MPRETLTRREFYERLAAGALIASPGMARGFELEAGLPTVGVRVVTSEPFVLCHRKRAFLR
jgi:hypothetical protein